VGLHLFNHALSVFGADMHIAVMHVLRLFYRNVFVESVLLIAVVLQIISGIKLVKANRKVASTKFNKLAIWTGLYLAVFLIIHVSAVFVGRLLLQLDTNFYFGVAGLNIFPFNLFFVPYYGLAVISFFGHIASVHNRKMKQTIFGWTPTAQSKFILVVGVIFTLVLFYGLTNRFKGVPIPAEYNIFGKKI
jgi:hypothetical protein